MSGVWKDIWTSLKAAVTVITSTVAFGLAILGSVWDPGVKVQIGLVWVGAIGFLVVTVLATAVKMTIDARRAPRGEPPKAISVYAPPALDNADVQPLTLIMSRSREFGVNIFVTIYYEESLGGGSGQIFERAIGIGRIVNIQTNGLIQVLVLREVLNQSGLWQRVRSGEMAILSHVVIKPSIDFNAVGIEVRFDERG
jgi:hypothetical protein